MDAWEIAFLVLLSLILGAVGIAVAFSVKDKLGNVTKPFSEYVTTWFSLFPYVFVLAGPIADVISNQYLYTKASIVGIISVIAVGLIFGSNWFASMSEKIVGWIPNIKDPLTGSWSWYGIGIWAIIAIFYGSTAFTFLKGTTTGGITMGAVAGVLLTIFLAGKGWLGGGEFSTLPSSSSFAGVTLSDVCTTPGLACVQSTFAPAGILLTSSILSAHLFESIDTQNRTQSIAIGSTLGTAFLIEYFIMMGKGCFGAYKYGWISPFISLALGLGFGSGAYYIMKGIGQGTESFGEGGIFHPAVAPTSKTQSGKKDSSIPTSGEAEQCSSGIDDFEDGDVALVGELFKDGVPITSDVTVA